MRAGDHLAAGIDENRTYGDLAGAAGACGFAQGEAHEMLVGWGHV
jgi:hypothetical protein